MPRNESHNGILICPGCDDPIAGGASVWYHTRLRVYLHNKQQCLQNVHGENVSHHTMTLMNIIY